MNNFNYMFGSGRHGMVWGGRGDFGGFDSFLSGLGPVGMFTVSIFFILGLALFLAVIALKGYSLWTAAKRNEKWWFIALLLVNTFGILELIYLIFVAKLWLQPKNKSAASGVANGQHGGTSHHEHKSEHKDGAVQAEKVE